MTLQLNPYTAVGQRYHKKWMQDKIQYLELVSEKLSAATREFVEAHVRPLFTGDQATRWVREQARAAVTAGKAADWIYRNVDIASSRAGVLLYRGIEVALFYKRQTTMTAMAPGSPIPEHAITDQDDVWQRLDLLEASAKKKNRVVQQRREKLERDVVRLRSELAELQEVYQQENEELRRYQRKERFKKEVKQERKEQEEAKLKKPFAPVPERDRLCLDCGCYENVHTFSKKGKCTGCTGAKPASKRWKVACKNCTFHPKGTRKKKLAPRSRS